MLTLTSAGSGIVNGVGDPLAADAVENWMVDKTAPTVSIVPHSCRLYDVLPFSLCASP